MMLKTHFSAKIQVYNFNLGLNRVLSTCDELFHLRSTDFVYASESWVIKL